MPSHAGGIRSPATGPSTHFDVAARTAEAWSTADPQVPCAALVLQHLVRGQRQEGLELVAQRHAVEQLARLVRAALRVEELVAHLLANLLELLRLVLAHQ